MFVDLDTILVDFDGDGKCERVLSAPEKAIYNCSSINWLLYRSKYWQGEDWNNIPSMKVKKDVIDGLLRWVYCDVESRNVAEMYNFSAHPYIRRTLCMK